MVSFSFNLAAFTDGNSPKRIQTQAEAGCLPDGVTKALRAVIDNTSEQISAIQICLSKILPSDGASKLERALKALKSLAKEDKVQQALEMIHNNSDVLVLCQTTRHPDGVVPWPQGKQPAICLFSCVRSFGRPRDRYLR